MVKSFIRIFIAIINLVLLSYIAGLTDLYASQIYWTTGGWGPGQIHRANLDGSESELLLSSETPVFLGIALDFTANKMYLAGEGKIQRADLDGNNLEELVTGDWFSEGIALDLKAGKMYWTTFDAPFIPEKKGTLQRANLDGTDAETLLTANERLNGLALDTVNDKIYWTQGNQWYSWSIYRANFDMTGIELIAEGIETLGIALDTVHKKIYWTDYGMGTVSRSNFDGSDIEELYVTSTGHPHSIALDILSGKMYWSEWGTNVLHSANLDGTGLDLFMSTDSMPMGIALAEPVWGAAYDVIFDNSSDLELFRQYRDEFLSNRTRGVTYKTLLYMFSEQALEVLLNNPELMTQAKVLIEANRDAVLDVLYGCEGIIYSTDQIAAFLNAYAQKSPPILKIMVYIIRWDMLQKQRRGVLFFGFRLK